MTVGTTSRNSTVQTRNIARDLCFALGCSYLPRGKHGLREIGAEEPLFFVVSQERGIVTIDLFHEGDRVLHRIVGDASFLVREGLLIRGITTSDSELAEIFSHYHDVIREEGSEMVLKFDGPQRRRTYLTLIDPE